MKYVHAEGSGGPEVLSIRDGKMPEPAAGQIRIQIAFAGVNRPDLMQRAGLYPAPEGASLILGLEASGIVDAIGEGVASHKIGDQVCALLAGGGYAQYAVVDALHALPIPDRVSLLEAGAIPETFFTVWSNVFDRAGLKSGEKFLVHGGASGIGTAAIQMAKAMGAEVFTTAGTDAKCAACEKLGARAINYRIDDFAEVLKGEKIDVILDMVGGDYITKNLRLLNLEGRLVNIAYQNGFKVEVNFLPVMLKRLKIMGSTLRPRTDEDKALIAQNLQTHIWPHVATGKIRPMIDKVFDLADVADAHAYLEKGAHVGKVVLKIGA